MSQITEEEYVTIREHAESCPHCIKLAEVLLIRIKEHKENLEK